MHWRPFGWYPIFSTVILCQGLRMPTCIFFQWYKCHRKIAYREHLIHKAFFGTETQNQIPGRNLDAETPGNASLLSNIFICWMFLLRLSVACWPWFKTSRRPDFWSFGFLGSFPVFDISKGITAFVSAIRCTVTSLTEIWLFFLLLAGDVVKKPSNVVVSTLGATDLPLKN